MIKVGEKLTSDLGSIEIKQELGSGTQGVVFLGSRGKNEAPVAVKWYYPENQIAPLRKNLELLVKDGAPSPHFLWPDSVVHSEGQFGYVMALRDTELASIPALMKRLVSTRMSVLVRACINTVSAFRALHARGLYYCDISHGNLFFHPKSGDIKICDNDNVGSDATAPGLVLGTQYYMAPEVVRGEAAPSSRTDHFSLAVLLFHLLYNGHPLLGARETQIHALDVLAVRHLCGTSPIYIFDPNDSSNRPVRGIHDNPIIYRGILPAQIQRVFEQAFTVGLNDQAGRPAFADWMTALASMEDSLVYCGHCRAENFARPRLSCWKCHKAVDIPLVLELPRRSLYFRVGAQIFEDHLSQTSDPGTRGAALAVVVANPNDPSLLGLQNLSQSRWFLTTDGGSAKEVEPGRTARLAAGNKISFGAVSGSIRAARP